MPHHLSPAQKKPILNTIKLLSLRKISYFISLMGQPYVIVNVTRNLGFLLLVNKWIYSFFLLINFRSPGNYACVTQSVGLSHVCVNADMFC